jgi:ABC-2 type transport system ATP-binding protein
LKADGGVLRIANYDLARQLEQARSRIGYLAQRFALYEDLTVLENIRFFAELRGLKAGEWKPRCLQILDFVNLGEFSHRRAGQLSGGMKQKLGLAAALVADPEVLLLDEPTTGVDPVTRQDFWQLILRVVAGQGTAVLISTQYMDEAARCTRIGLIQSGRLLLEEAPARLASQLEERVIELGGRPLPRLRELARQLEGVEDVQMFGDRMHLRVQPGAAGQVVAALRTRFLLEEVDVTTLRLIRPSLEDVFIHRLEEN